MLERLLFALFIALTISHVADAQEPQWLTEARAREGKLVKAKKIRSADGFFRAAVPAKLIGKVVADDDSYQMQLDLGSETPASCEIIRDGFDPAALLRAVADLTFTQVEQAQGKVEARAVERIDAGAFRASPYLAVEWIYRVNDGSEARVGGIKQIAIAKDGHGLYCAHVELGYARTFHDVVRALAESLEFSQADPEPYYSEIHTASLQGRRIGTANLTMTRDSDGDTKVVTRMSLLVPVTPDTLRSMDAYDVEWTRPDGSLINASHVTAENGELETNLSLTETDDEQWLVEGDYMGKQLSEVIAAGGPPGTSLAYARSKRELLRNGNAVGGKVSTMQWLSSDPTRLHEATTSIVAALEGGRFTARESVAGLSADIVLDESTGTAVSGTVPIGPVSIELERAHVRGEL